MLLVLCPIYERANQIFALHLFFNNGSKVGTTFLLLLYLHVQCYFVVRYMMNLSAFLPDKLDKRSERRMRGRVIDHDIDL